MGVNYAYSIISLKVKNGPMKNERKKSFRIFFSKEVFIHELRKVRKEAPDDRVISLSTFLKHCELSLLGDVVIVYLVNTARDQSLIPLEPLSPGTPVRICMVEHESARARVCVTGSGLELTSSRDDLYALFLSSEGQKFLTGVGKLNTQRKEWKFENIKLQ